MRLIAYLKIPVYGVGVSVGVKGVGVAKGKLTDRTVRSLKAGTYGDGAGLYLQVLESGARSWLYRYKHGGKTTWLGLGGYPAVGLAEAREAALEAKRKVTAGTDPLEAKKQAKAERESLRGATFKKVAEQYIAAKRVGWKNAKHADQWRSTLEAYAYPVIGNMPVSSVTVAEVKAILEPIWTEKPETASRVRGQIENILNYAAAHNEKMGDNPARWHGRLQHMLTARSEQKTPQAAVKHHAAAPYDTLPALMAKLGESQGAAAACLRFAILTAARSGEARGVTWDEIDLDAAVWTVPAARMKASKEHRVPLSPAAVAVLKSNMLPDNAQKPAGGLVFRGGVEGRPLSDVAVAKALRVAGGQGYTPHGMRSSFRDWAAAKTDYPREICETALAHGNRDKVEAAYLRGDHFEKRRKLMEVWAMHCLGLKAEAS